MEFAALDRSLRTARRSRNIFALFTSVLLAIVLMLAVTLTKTTRTTVLVPTTISDGMVASGTVDMRYVEALALDAVYAFYNTSPNTTDRAREVVERLSSTRDRAALLEAFDKIASDIRARKITTVFFVSRLETNLDGMRIEVVGSLRTFIETKLITSKPVRVRVSLVREASSARLAAMEVVEEELG